MDIFLYRNKTFICGNIARFLQLIKSSIQIVSKQKKMVNQWVEI